MVGDLRSCPISSIILPEKDSIELRDAFSLLELGDEMAYAAVQKRFKLAVHERSIHHRYRREGTDSEKASIGRPLGF